MAALEQMWRVPDRLLASVGSETTVAIALAEAWQARANACD